MSNENDDIDAGLQRDVQPDTPSGEPPALGPEPVREPPEAAAAGPLPGADEEPVGQPSAPLPAVCGRCAAPVPEGAGRCPGCGTFQKENVESVVHGLRSKKLAKIVDAYRVDLINHLVAERGGKGALDVASRIAIENYALVCAQHKTIEARLDQDGLFTQTGRRRSAFDMLKAISETIDRLRAQLPPILTSTTTAGYADLESLPIESLIEKATDNLRGLIGLQDFETQRAATLAAEPAQTDTVDAAGRPVQAETEPCGERSEPTLEPTCLWCNRAPCIGSTHHAFEVLHWRDPVEISKRNKAATAVMMRMTAGVRSEDIAFPAEPKDSPEEAKARALRRELGWESFGRTIDHRGFVK